MESKNQRQFRNILINPNFQFRFGFYFVSTTMVISGLLLFFIYYQLAGIKAVIFNSKGIPADIQIQVTDLLSNAILLSSLFMALLAVSIFAISLVLSHRTAGPMYAIIEYIKQLKAGEYTTQRKLRPNDELGPIMDALHELAQTLNSKGASAPKS